MAAFPTDTESALFATDPSPNATDLLPLAVLFAPIAVELFPLATALLPMAVVGSALAWAPWPMATDPAYFAEAPLPIATVPVPFAFADCPTATAPFPEAVPIGLPSLFSGAQTKAPLDTVQTPAFPLTTALICVELLLTLVDKELTLVETPVLRLDTPLTAEEMLPLKLLTVVLRLETPLTAEEMLPLKALTVVLRLDTPVLADVDSEYNWPPLTASVLDIVADPAATLVTVTALVDVPGADEFPMVTVPCPLEYEIVPGNSTCVVLKLVLKLLTLVTVVDRPELIELTAVLVEEPRLETPELVDVDSE